VSGEECTAAGLGDGCLPDGTCVECDEHADCGGPGCDPRTNLCSTNRAGSVGQCQACLTDLDCDAGSGCVVVSFPVDGGVEIGTYCALDCSDPGGLPVDVYCSSNVGRGNTCHSIQPRDRESAESAFCVPATTTCEGYLAHDRPGCEGLQGTCSHDGDGDDADGTCAGGTCTYPCNDDADCPGGYDCGGDLAGNCDVN
jgi:hypothetical protein